MAGGVSIGPRIQVDGEERYRNQIKSIIEQSKTLDAEMQALTATFTDETSAQEKARQSQYNLNEQLDLAKERTRLVREMTQKAAEATKENSTETLKWRQALANAEEQQAKLERAVEENTKALEDAEEGAEEAGVSIEKYGESADDASEKTNIFADVLKGNLVSNAISAAIDGLKELGEMAIDFGKQVIESYGELEQNLGGSEAVFGEYAEAVKQASADAYSAIGASQSEYLASANKIGALFQGSGVEVERSMELTTKAIQRAADVASVMGVDTSAALEAVTGAAKGNYTMMDNLGVKMDATTLKAYALEKGMAATWEEMSNAEKAELAMQYFFEQTEKYAGNFEEESRQTISGSIGMMQASIETWIAGLGDSEADIGKLTENVIDSFETVVSNTVPIVENVINSIPEIYDSILSAVAEKSPELAEKLDNFMQPMGDILQSLKDLGESVWPIVEPVLDSALWMLGQVAEVLKEVVGWAQTAVDWLMQAGDWLEAHKTEVTGYEDYGFGGTADYGYGDVGHNAAGTDFWRGGETWVGEEGPEKVWLPRGTQIYSNQESRQMATASTDTRAMEGLLGQVVTLLGEIRAENQAQNMRRRMA